MDSKIEVGLKFSENIDLMKGAHILYTYTDEELYLENVYWFMSNGLDLDQGIVYVDRIKRWVPIKERLINKGYSKKQIESIVFGNSEEYYTTNEYVNSQVVSDSVAKLFKPFLDQSIPLRTWACVEWQDHNDIYEKLRTHEELTDDFIKQADCFTICAYDGNKLPASVQHQILTSHQYIMTDTELFTSRLYKGALSLPKIYVGKALEESIGELNKYKEEVSRLDQLNLIGQMAASISHEVRNPMTTVRGFLQILSEKPGCTDYADYFTLMIEELDRANLIITEFLSLSKNHLPEFELADINSLIISLLPLLSSDANRREVNMRTELQKIPGIILDPKEFKQVILNLVQNGLEVTPKGKSLTIRTYSWESDIILEISDQGPGIPEYAIDKIGTPFFTTKVHGTGLGLSVCYRIIERHQAKMTFETSSEGTTFKIIFSGAENKSQLNSLTVGL
jgi:signal transduction histidine kinase